MTTQLIEKVDISRVLIHSVDGSASSARVSSIEAANSVLKSWAHDQSGTLPAECEVEIVFEDGLRYRGHYRLEAQEKGISLGRDIRRRLAAMTRTPSIKKVETPANDSIICPQEQDPVKCATALLTYYNI